MKTNQRTYRENIFKAMGGALAAIIFLLGVSLLGESHAQSQTAPTMITFQGRLTDNLNNPLGGSHNFIFKIFDNSTGAGTALWTETQNGVTVTNGALGVQLGAVTALSTTVFAGATTYLQITVDGTALSPLEQLVSVPYAMNSLMFGGRDYTGFISTDTATQVAAGTKTFSGAIYVPYPSSASQAASKAYVDGATGSGAVQKTGDGMTGPLTMLSGATITISGNAFSVGGSSFTVSGGSATVAYGMTATAFYGYGGNLSGLPSSENNTYASSKTFTSGVGITGGNVGIGTTAPATKLEVNGDAQFGSGVNKSTFSVAGDLFMNSGSSITLSGANGFITSVSSVNASAFFGSGAALTGIPSTASIAGSYVAKAGDGMSGPLTMLSGSTITVSGSAFSVGGSTLVVIGGKVGIGTTVPSYLLDVAQGINVNRDGVVTSGFINGITMSGWDAMGLLSSGSNMILGGYRGSQWDAIRFYTSGSEKMRLDTNGRLGIGTTAPAAGLDVNGNAQFGSGINKSTFSATGDLSMNSGSSIILSGANGFITGASSVNASAFFGSGAALTGIPSTASIAGAYVARTGDGMSGPLTMLSGSTITISGNAFSVGGSTLVVSGGSVGVGTTSPGAPLHVVGTELRLGGAVAPRFSLYHSDGTTLYSQYAIATAANHFLTGSAQGDTILAGQTSNSKIHLGQITNDNLVMTVDGQNERVGIGTIFPIANLDVNGNAQFGSGINKSTFSTAGDLFMNSGSSITLSGANGFITSASSIIASAFFGSGAALTGIPSTASIAGAYVAKAGDAMTGPLTMLSGSTITISGNAFSVGGSTLVVASGNIGIGTSAPGAKLDVNGVIRGDISTFSEPINAGTTDAGGDKFIIWESLTPYRTALGMSGGGLYIQNTGGNAATDGIRFFTGASIATEAMRIGRDGYVGIGTAVPVAKLHMSSGTLLIDGDAATAFKIGTSSLVVTSAGNVGIGMAVPTGKLHVYDGDIRISTTVGAASKGIYFQDGTLQTTAADPAAYAALAATQTFSGANTFGSSFTVRSGGREIVLSTSSIAGTSSIFISTQGRVGIGTSVPSSALEVSGAVIATSSVSSPIFQPLTGEGNSVTLQANANSNAAAGGSVNLTAGNSTLGCISGACVGGTVSLTSGGDGYGGLGSNLSLTGAIILSGTSTRGGTASLSGGNTSDGGNSNLVMGGNVVISGGRNTAGGSTATGAALTVGGGAGSGIRGNVIIMPGSGGTSQGFVGIATGTPSALFQVGAATLAVTSEGSVGISTLAPTSRLHVHDGDIRISTTMGAASKGIYFQDGTLQTTAFGAGSFVQKTGDAMTGPLTMQSGSTITVSGNAFSVGDSTFVVRGGKVGVGTSSPNIQMSVVGASTGELGISGGGGKQFGIYSGADDATIYADTSSAAEGRTLHFARHGTGGGTMVTFKNDGRVGIGATAPAARLHVSSASALSTDTILQVSSGTSAGQELMVVKGDGKVGVGTSNPVYLLQVRGAPVSGAPTVSVQSNSPANTSYSAIVPMNSAGNGMYMTIGDANYSASYFAKALWGTIAGTTGVNLRFGANTRSDDMVIDGSGNVGISTSVPLSKLHVHDGDIRISTTVGAASKGIYFQDGSLQTTAFGGAGSFVQRAGDGMTGPLTMLSGSTITVTGNAFSVGGSTFVVAGGNVGVGTTNPGSKLDVQLPAGVDPAVFASRIYGGSLFINADFDLTNADRTGRVYLGTRNGAQANYLDYAQTGANAGNFNLVNAGLKITPNVADAFVLNVASQNGVGMLYVNAAGNVGVGTTNPTNGRLAIQTQSTSQNPLWIQNPSQQGRFAVELLSDAANLYMYDSTGGQGVVLRTDGAGPSFVKTGSVGISTSAPTSKLHVHDGDIRISTTMGAASKGLYFQDGTLQTTAFSGAGSFVQRAGDGMTGPLTMLSGSTITVSGNAFSVGASTLVVAGGNVGVGTTDPVAIDGGAATKFHVKVNGGTGNVEVARFEGGGDADDTYGVLRVNHNNDRGFFVKGGRQTGNTPIATMGLTDNSGGMTDIMTFLGGGVGIGTATPVNKLETHGIAVAVADGSVGGGEWYQHVSAIKNATANDTGIGYAFGHFTGGVPVITGSNIFAHVVGVPQTPGTENYRGHLAFHTRNATSMAERLRITEDGNTGIGTTAPASVLHVLSSTSAANALIIATGTAVSEQILRVSTDGIVFAAKGFTYGADLAEMYPSEEPAEPGDVMAVSPASGADDSKPLVLKATAGRREALMGVVSTNPGTTLGWNRIDQNEQRGHVALGLAGRIPVKVTAENGTVRPGDFLTVSSIRPGYAAKAVTSGMVVGMALEAMKDGAAEGKVMTFVNLQNWVAPGEFESLREEIRSLRKTMRDGGR